MSESKLVQATTDHAEAATRSPWQRRIGQIETEVLAALACSNGFWCFKHLSRVTKLDRKLVRRTCRLLARKGLAEFGKGLWSEDGEPRGSGYAATSEGRRRADSTLTGIMADRNWD
jgi:hypothetical protein